MQRVKIGILVILVAACGARAESGAPTPAEWTYMNYLMGDTQDIFGKWCVQEVAKMAKAGSAPNVNVIAQIDAKEFEAGFQCERLKMVNGQSQVVQKLGQVNMASAATLRDFLAWGMQNFPARRYAVVLTGHSKGWNGFGWDQKKTDSLHLHEISQAFRESGLHAQLVVFKAPMMGMMEVAYELAPHADILVASENLTRTPIWEHEAAIRPLLATPTLEPERLALEILSSFDATTPYDNRTYSAIDLRAILEIKKGLDDLARSLTDELDSQGDALADIRAGLHGMVDQSSSGGYSFSSHVDLVDLLGRLEAMGSTVAAQARALKAKITDAVLGEVHGSSTEFTHGLAIFFPANPSELDGHYDPMADSLTTPNPGGFLPPRFVKEGQWFQFLSAFHARYPGKDPHEPDGSFLRAWPGLADGVDHDSYIWQTFEADNYRVVARGAMDVALAKPPARNFDMKLWDQAGNLVKLVYGADQPALAIQVPDAHPGAVYYITVRGYGDRDRENAYRLNVRGIAAPPSRP